MTKITSLATAAFLTLATLGSTPAFADKERCKVYVSGDYELIGRTFTDGGCASKARELVGPKMCRDGEKKFDYKYMFDGQISRRTSFCSNLK